MKTKKFYTLDDDKLVGLIESQTGQRFDLLAEFEWTNDSWHVAYDCKACGGSDLQDWKTFKATGEIGDELYFSLSDLINGLIYEKVLPKGNYIIGVCW